MNTAEAKDISLPAGARTRSNSLRNLRRLVFRFPVFPAAVLVAFGVAGTLGPLLVPRDPTSIDLAHALLPPAFLDGGDSMFALGTDDLGRDLLSRLFGGARVSLLVGLSVVCISGAIGLSIALIAGFVGGRVDAVLMRITDTVLAFPVLLLALVIVGIFGASERNVVVVLAAAGWATYARVLRSEVLSLRSRDFVSMALVMGGGPLWIIRCHLLPNILGTVFVLATLQLGHAIVAEGSLSFLGLGIPSPAPSWGGMLSDGRRFLTSAWWLPMIPGLALSLTVLSFNLFGDWLRSEHDSASS